MYMTIRHFSFCTLLVLASKYSHGMKQGHGRRLYNLDSPAQCRMPAWLELKVTTYLVSHQPSVPKQSSLKHLCHTTHRNAPVAHSVPIVSTVTQALRFTPWSEAAMGDWDAGRAGDAWLGGGDGLIEGWLGEAGMLVLWENVSSMLWWLSDPAWAPAPWPWCTSLWLTSGLSSCMSASPLCLMDTMPGKNKQHPGVPLTTSYGHGRSYLSASRTQVERGKGGI
jgi:hypothetical protein